MLPNISADVIEKQKILQPGNCVGFGGAFKLPMVVKLEMPNPAPNSNSCDVNNCWKVQGTASQTQVNNTGSVDAVQSNNTNGQTVGANNVLDSATPNEGIVMQDVNQDVQNLAPKVAHTTSGGETVKPKKDIIKPSFVPPVS
jgi:hypothetical protein